MRSRADIVALLAAALLAGSARSQSGPWNVTRLDEEWRDEARGRTVPVRVFVPEAPRGAVESRPTAPAPVIVWSPGLGGSRSTYSYLTNHLASHGYLVVAVTHAGSDTRDFGARIANQLLDARSGDGPGSRPLDVLLDAVNDADNLRNRPRDVSFVLDRLAVHPVLGPRADLGRAGAAGHSFGAYTAMAVGGMRVDLPESKAHSFRNPRIKAVLPMSPQGTGTMGLREGAWSSFAVPVLFMTGTNDYGASGASAAWRRSGFENTRGADSWLVTIEGAGHMTFAAPVRKQDRAGTPKLIRSLSVTFFDASLKGDPAARKRLNEFFAGVHDDCVAEHRPARAAPESR
jgi:predicted dienelactone hydrolase